MSRKKKKAVVLEEATSLPEFEQPFVEAVEEKPELREVIQPESSKPQSFRSLREAKAYAKENGGKVVEKGRFYVR